MLTAGAWKFQGKITRVPELDALFCRHRLVFVAIEVCSSLGLAIFTLATKKSLARRGTCSGTVELKLKP